MAIDAFEKLPSEKQDAILQTGIVIFSQKTYHDESTY